MIFTCLLPISFYTYTDFSLNITSKQVISMVHVFIDDSVSSQLCEVCRVNTADKHIKFREQHTNSYWNSNLELLLCLHCYNQLKEKILHSQPDKKS